MTDEIYTYREAAEYLVVKPVTIRLYAASGKLESAGADKVTVKSVKAYAKTRNPDRSEIARKAGGSRKWKNRRHVMLDMIYQAVVDHYIEHGYAPVFEDLVQRVALAKSGLSRYLPDLVKDGRIEIHGKGKQILMAGMAENTKKWAAAHAKKPKT